MDVDTNNSNPNDAGAMWTPGETFTDAANGITVTVNAMNASSFNVTIVKAGTAPRGSATQPQSQTIASGQTATMSVVATGTQPLTYQWYVGASGNTASPIGGATSSSYTTPALTTATSYWVRVSNAGGQANSNTATISIGVGPSVTAHPSSLTRKAGKSAAFTSAATGSPTLTVRWQVSATSGGPWTDVAGATSTTLTFAATAADHGKWFHAVFTNGVGQAASNAASLTVRSVSGSDFNGDGATDLAVYRPATGEWFARNQPAVSFGGPGYVPVAGDYNGDGTTDLAVYEPSTGTWFVRNQLAIQFGDAGDVPVPGDYNGDGTTDIAVYRPSTGAWFVRNQLAVTGFGGLGFQPVGGRLQRRRRRPTWRCISRPPGSGTCATSSRSSSAEPGDRAGAGRLQRRWRGGSRLLPAGDRVSGPCGTSSRGATAASGICRWRATSTATAPPTSRSTGRPTGQWFVSGQPTRDVRLRW